MSSSTAMTLFGCISAVAMTAGAQPGRSGTVEGFLSNSFGFVRAELADLGEGRPIVRALRSADRREISSVGVVSVDIAPAAYIERLRDIAVFKRSEGVLQIGTFGGEPAIQDVAQLTLPDDDRRALTRCRPGRCEVQLPADALDRIARAASAPMPGGAERVDGAFRAEVVRMASTYLDLGEAGMPVYHDTPTPTSMAVEFRSLVWDEPAVLREFDGLSEHLRRFPRRTPGIEDQLYWSREKVGPVEVISITHLAIQALPGGEPVAFIAASRQVYGSHYFDASLGVTFLLSEPEDPAATVVAYVNRSRLDVFGGLLGPMKRSVAASRSRDALARFLTVARNRVEDRGAAKR